ncbi:MAG: hypothetical protein ACPKM1_15670 [Spirochaetaceae bacterium]
MGFIDDAVDAVTDFGKEIGQYVPGVGQLLAGREAEKLAERQAELDRQTTERQASVLAEENQRKAALARAQAAASGVGGETVGIYIDALEQAGREEIAWLREVGAEKYQIAMDEGELLFDQALAGFWGDMASMASMASGGA